MTITLPDVDARTVGPDAVPVALRINGAERVVALEPRVSLLERVDGRRVLACLTLAVAADGHHVETIEGLADGDELHPMQQAFIDLDAFQCG